MRKGAESSGFVPICVSVTPARRGELRDLAKLHDTSVSAIVNAALDDLLAVQEDEDVKGRLDGAPLRRPKA